MVKAKALCTLRNGETAFIVECKSSTAMNAINTLKQMINREFDHCFEADQWHLINIIIERV